MIDWDRLLTLRSDIGEEDFADIAFMFVSEIDELLTRLLYAPHSAQGTDFHYLRGSAANLGFVGLAEACTAAEKACAAGQAPDVSGIFGIFKTSLAEASPKMPELAQAA